MSEQTVFVLARHTRAAAMAAQSFGLRHEQWKYLFHPSVLDGREKPIVIVVEGWETREDHDQVMAALKVVGAVTRPIRL